MPNNEKCPVALGGAHRAEAVKTDGIEFDRRERTSDALAFQAAFVAHRYRLSPRMARLVCHLARIGEGLA